MTFLVMLAFYPNQRNPARPSGRGVYRVKGCEGPIHHRRPIRVISKRLFMDVPRRFKIGSRIDPARWIS